MTWFHRYTLGVGCLMLAVVLAATPVSAQRAPDLRSLPVRDPAARVEQNGAIAEPGAALAPYDRSIESSRYRLPNGLDVTVFGAEALAARLESREGEDVIPLDDGRYLSVITDIDDPSVYNKGDGTFHPFREDWVVEVLKGISHPSLDLDVKVYLLPYPRRNLLVSSTSDNCIFLSPHVLEIHSAVCAYIVAHEMGHVFHNAYMPDGSPLWNRYRRLRGITNDDIYSATGPHAYRPKEIFAEDFRVFYGGEEAAFGGRIENPGLDSPFDVAGLLDFFAGIGGTPVAVGPAVRAASYPNPFNPETEIRIVIPERIVASRERVTVRIYDVSGALVKTLYSDVPPGKNLYVRWDGRDRAGAAVASAQYFALIEAGPARTTLKLLLLK